MSYGETNAIPKSKFRTGWSNRPHLGPEGDAIRLNDRAQQVVIFRLRNEHCWLFVHLSRLGCLAVMSALAALIPKYLSICCSPALWHWCRNTWASTVVLLKALVSKHLSICCSPALRHWRRNTWASTVVLPCGIGAQFLSICCSPAQPSVPWEARPSPGRWGLIKSCEDWWQPFGGRRILRRRPTWQSECMARECRRRGRRICWNSCGCVVWWGTSKELGRKQRHYITLFTFPKEAIDYVFAGNTWFRWFLMYGIVKTTTTTTTTTISLTQNQNLHLI